MRNSTIALIIDEASLLADAAEGVVEGILTSDLMIEFALRTVSNLLAVIGSVVT